LLENFRADFDYVFVLTPYSEKTADSLIVAKDVNNILFLIDPYKLSKLDFLKVFNKHKKFNKDKSGVVFYE